MSGGHQRPSTRGTLYKKKDDRGKLPNTLSAGQVQNVKKQRVYVFGEADVYDEDVVEFEMSEVRSRKAPKQMDQSNGVPEYFEREITEGDTLQSLSLQYGCPVSEIKRINNLIRDQEFYGLRIVKVPMKKHSFLSEHVNEQKQKEVIKKARSNLNGAAVSQDDGIEEYSGSRNCDVYHRRDSDDETDTESVCNLSDPETQRLLIKTLSINDAYHSQSKEAKEFLKNMDRDLSKLRNTTRTERNSLDEVISVLTNKSVQPIVVKNKKMLSGADCGVRWWSVLIIMLVVGILFPLVYFLYQMYVYIHHDDKNVTGHS